MKYTILILMSMFIQQISFAQCLDVYNNPCVCPTSEDSMLIYENSLKVYKYYEDNTYYKKIKITKILTYKDFKACFYKLDSAYQAFKEIWQIRERYLKGENVNMAEKGIVLPKGGKNIPVEDYFERIDEYRFYQRELECGILNTNSPIPVYDIRIAPLYMNVYRNHSAKDDFNGDQVEVALYVPVTVKPYELLTDAELEFRKKILGNRYIPQTVKQPKKDTIAVIKEEPVIVIKKDTIAVQKIPFKKEIQKTVRSFVQKVDVIRVKPVLSINTVLKPPIYPVYYGNGVTSCLIGKMDSKGVFVKVPKSEHRALPRFARELLMNDEQLKKHLRIKFGDFFKEILADEQL
jgi:hypothetical protein